MKLIKLGAGVLNQTPLDWDGNDRNIRAAIQKAKDDEVTVLCLPEMCITGYGCEDAFHARGVQRTALEVLRDLLPATEGIVVSVGLPLLFKNSLFNTACLLVDGQVAGFVAKRALAGDGLHYEPRWFRPWPRGVQTEVKIHGQAYPVGDLLFEVGGVKIGFEICEDAWVADRPGVRMAQLGADVILNPSASHFAFDKLDVRKRFVLEGSRAFGVSYVYANLLGNEAGRAIYDGGALIATHGKLLAEGARFSFHDVVLTTAEVDVTETRMKQARIASFQPDLREVEGATIHSDFVFPKREPAESRPTIAAWEESESIKEEEFTRAEALALFDYLRKSFSQGFVVSLSGGADSAAVACLIGQMVRLALADLGARGLLTKLSHIRTLGELEDRTPELITGALLLCVYQATRNSSDVTSNAAKVVAEAIGSEFKHVTVDELVDGYTKLAEGALGRQMTWEQDDIALQNIQARVRSPSIWMLANVRNALLLATSNRSEAAVGYATMDGDTSGGLSPIAGIDKAFLRQWLRWLQTDGPLGSEPVPALSAVNEQQPTAELRPQEAEQTDEGDLMPYPILDAIERLAIRDKLAPLHVFRRMRSRNSDVDPQVMGTYVERFFKLWCRNQWKRERYAPSFHLDDENLDPKTWCRFPILSGGYKRELQALRAHLETL